MNTLPTKTLLRAAAALLALAILALIYFGGFTRRAPQKTQASNAAPSTKKILYWYDPMHPSYKSDKPGTAPDCGMDLVPMMEGEGAANDGMIQLSPARQQALDVKLATVEERELASELKASGALAADERRITHVHVRTPGWIEELYGAYQGGYVKKGEPLFTVYSPEMVAAEREYLIAREGVKKLGASPYAEAARGAHEMLDAARRRLEAYELDESQMRRLNETGEIARAYLVRSPASGYVLERKAYPKASVDGATDIFTIVDLSQLWVIANVYESELPYVKTGAPAQVTLSFLPGRAFAGRIAASFPEVDAQTHTARVRIDLANRAGELKPGMFAEVAMHLNHGRHLALPDEAVLDTGDHQYVFVAHEDGKFEPREVNAGESVNGWTVIDFGLEKGEKVVAEGNFLLDSESRMRAPKSASETQR